MLDTLARVFPQVAPKAEFCSLRYQSEANEALAVRQGVLQPPRLSEDAGAMVTVADGGGVGYAATADVSAAGLRRAAARALDWARRSAGRTLPGLAPPARPAPSGAFSSPVSEPWESVPLAAKVDLLREACARLKRDERIVDWSAGLWHTRGQTCYLDTAGARVQQSFAMLVPDLRAVAHAGGETVSRSLGGHGMARQGGLEVLDAVGFARAPERVAAEAVELLLAAQCPTGTMDLVLAPDQMILQIHESIGHPLELDRILGDERNYAGTSFVTLDMFGTYRYGSELLDVTFDPDVPGQLASYGFDDDGEPARREYLIRQGLLVRPLGGRLSQQRAGIPGVANARASGWNRPPIDRMANLNLEPGDLSLDALVGGVERGVYMETNCSWSIDDSRNKFQFGCEFGRRIEDGRLGAVVKKCNYRGISAEFWRGLTGVGDRSTFQVLGTPFCGKGEPNQLVRVGHATPACRFTGVSVFGGA